MTATHRPNYNRVQRMGARSLDYSRINLSPSRSAILDSLRLWAAEVRALGLDTLEGCKTKPLPGH